MDEVVEEEVLVEGQKEEEADPSETSASVTVIPIDERIAASQDLGSVLNSASGTVVRRLGGLGDYSAVSIRGSSFRQVQVFVDGIPLNPDGSSAVNLAELPLSYFQRVEVYRGNAPSHFAAAPLGGVVNLVTQSSDHKQGAVSYGSMETARMVVSLPFQGQWAGKPVDSLLLADGFQSKGDFLNFSDNGTIYNVTDDTLLPRQNNQKTQFNSYVRWRVGDERLRFSFSDVFLTRDEGVPGTSNLPSLTTNLATRRNIATAQLEGQHSAAMWNARLWSNQRLERYDNRSGEVGIGRVWEESNYGTLGVLGSYAHGFKSWLLPRITLSAHRDTVKQTDLMGGGETREHSRLAAVGVIGLDTWLLQDQIKLSPVVQVDWLNNQDLTRITESNTGYAVDRKQVLSVLSPRAGLLLRPKPTNWLSLKANWGEYLRPPDFSELFGNRGSIVGNDELVSESGWQWDVGARATAALSSGGAAAFDLTYFERKAENQIVFIQNSQRTSIPVNFAAAHLRGVEAALTLGLWDWVDSQSNLTWTDSENLTPVASDRGKRLPRVPEWEMNQSTSVHWKSHIRLGHSFSYTAGNYWDAANLLNAAPRALHSVFFRVENRGLSFESSILNLTDEMVVVGDRNPFSAQDDTPILQPVTDFLGYPLPGRTFLFTLRWTSPSKATSSSPS